MPRYRSIRIAIVTLGTGFCLLLVVGSVVQLGMAPLAGATEGEKDAYAVGLMASVLALTAATIAYRYPKASAIVFGLSVGTGQLSIREGNRDSQFFVGMLVVLCLAACYGVFERKKDVMALQRHEREA